MLKIKNTLTKETKYLLIVGMLFLAGSNIASFFECLFSKTNK